MLERRSWAAALLIVPALLAASGCARTDADLYTAGDAGEATFHNFLTETLYLSGCAPFVFERSLDGDWVDQGPPFHCIWEGIAVPVAQEERIKTPFDAPYDSGIYRLRYDVGARCQPDVPLSQAQCEVRNEVVSDEFEVERELCDASEPDCRHVPAAPNILCEDGVHFAGPAAECTRDPASGRCGYEFLRCP